MKAIAKIVSKAGAKSPLICLIGGGAAVIGGVVMAHRAGRKVEDTLDNCKERIDDVRSRKDSTEVEDENGEMIPYTEKDYKKDLSKAYVGSAWKFAKLYLPPIILTTGGILCFVKGHRILGKRLAGVTAAYECVNKAFHNYRQNVIDFDGSDQDKRYLYGIQKEKGIDMEVVDPETGEVTTVTTNKNKSIDVINDDARLASPYAITSKMCGGWTEDSEHNYRWLRLIESECNAKLKQVGYLYLHDVYEVLGANEKTLTPAAIATSHVVGWIRGEGDDQVIFDVTEVPVKGGLKDGAFTPYKYATIIDFNCQGTIVDKF